MSKKIPNNSAKSLANYKWVEKNIYKTGNRYRVRVAGMSNYAPTLTQARKMRKYMRVSQKQGFII